MVTLSTYEGKPAPLRAAQPAQPEESQACEPRTTLARSGGLLGNAPPPVRLPQREGEPRPPREAARTGVSTPAERLPYAEQIQQSFGRHEIGQVRAHLGDTASKSAAALGAAAFATGSDVVFARTPDLHTAAHEAAHVVQQRSGLSLPGGMGRADDSYEQNADDVAARVAAGQSAESLLDRFAPSDSGLLQTSNGPVQRKVEFRQAFGDYWVSEVTMSRRGERGLFGPHKGDHTTAHGVLRDWIVNNVEGIRLSDAKAKLDELYGQIKDLPWWEDISGEMKISDEVQTEVDAAQEAALNAIVAFREAYDEYEEYNTPEAIEEYGSDRSYAIEDLKEKLDTALQALLRFRNTTPLAAAREGGTGHRERWGLDLLRELEGKYAAGQNPRVDDEDLIKRCVAVLDTGRLSQEFDFSGDNAEEDIANFPGTTLNVAKDQAHIITHHVTNLQHAYPNLWARKLSGLERQLRQALEAGVELGDDEEYNDEDEDDEE